MFFRQVFDRKLAQYSYVIGCQANRQAVVVDPMRDVEVYLEIARAERLDLAAVAETHIHADFLSGARELAHRTGATVYVSGEGGPDWQSEWLNGGEYRHRVLRDGDHFMIGRIRFDVMFTPGHTPEHVCYLVTDTPAGVPIPLGLLSGDFVFVGDVGRPDLLETAAGQVGATEPGARALYQSLQKFRALNPATQVWPCHGAGSACGKALSALPMSTVGYELTANPAIAAARDAESFVAYILDGQPEPPLYFARMKRDNRIGPALLGAIPEPKRIPPNKLADLSGATGVAVVDTRAWDAYRHAHLPGALFAPLNTAFNTTVGCYVPEKTPIILLVAESRLREAVVDLIRIGLDHIAGYATVEMFDEYARKGKTAAIAEIDAAELERQMGQGAFLLDVRRESELAATGRIPGAHNIAHTRLLARIDEVPKNRPILVHCQTGSRSSYAAGLLDRLGYRASNLAGGFEAWKAKGGAALTA